MAKNHLERLHLDLYKNMLLHLQDKIQYWNKVIESQLVLLKERPYPLSDVVKFQKEFYEKREMAEKVLTHAKQQECLQEKHSDKINLLCNAKKELEDFNNWVNQEYYKILPYLEESIQIAKKDNKRFWQATIIWPAVFVLQVLSWVLFLENISNTRLLRVVSANSLTQQKSLITP